MSVPNGTFKLVIKDGQSDYKWDAKKNLYTNVLRDSVEEFDNIADALAEFLYTVTDNYTNRKASLIFVPAKDKKNKK